MKNHPLLFTNNITELFSKGAGECFEFAHQVLYV